MIKYNGSAANVTVPQGVFEIADGAFESNVELESLNLSDKVVFIGERAFFGCENLCLVNGTSNVAKIGAQAFENTKWFDNITTDIKMINNIVIGCQSDLQRLEIPDYALSVAPKAFYNNTKITKVICGSDMQEIGNYAFYGCVNLTEAVLGKRISYIGNNAFFGTKWLENSNDEFTVINGILIKHSAGASDVALPDNIKQIAGGTFYEDKKLNSIVLPDNLYYIGDNAFAYSSLKEINLSESSVSYIGKGAFEGCTELVKIDLDKKINFIGENAFEGCDNLTVNVEPESYAYGYVTENGLNHSIVGVLGDLDGDGAVTMMDVVALQKYIAKLIPLTIEATRLADIDQSTEITMQDVTFMQKRIAGLI